MCENLLAIKFNFKPFYNFIFYTIFKIMEQSDTISVNSVYIILKIFTRFRVNFIIYFDPGARGGKTLKTRRINKTYLLKFNKKQDK